MTFVSYAQTFEDVRLWRAFRDVGAGRYIDIGAQDPVRDSISLAFYERGWRGIHVEPTAAYAEALRNARPDETVIEAVVTTAPGPIKFFEIPSTGLSTGIAEIAKRHSGAGWDYREMLVPAVTLAGLFDCYGPELVHWLKIDVEGMEADVLASWGDHSARPAVLIIEATAPNTQIQTHTSWYDLVLDKGYHDVVFDGLSRFFVHQDHAHLRDLIAESPNIFDGFHVSDQHFTAEKLIKKRQEEAVAAVTAELRARSDAAEAAAEARIVQVHADYAVLEERFVQTQDALDEATQSLAQCKGSLDQTTQRLAETEHALSETTQRLGQVEGAFNESLQNLSEVEEILDDTRKALAETETALRFSAAREETAASRLAEVTAKLEALQTEHGLLLRETGYLQGQLEATSKAGAERLAETTARLDRAEQEWRLASAELSSTKDEIARLLSAQINLERRLQRAGTLLASAPSLDAHLSSLRGALVRWLIPRKAVTDWARHAAEVALFQADAGLPTGSIAADAVTAIPPPQPAFPNSASAHGALNMFESDEPITTVPRLLEPHDRQFIHTAYQSILGRAPDPEGERYYLARLRAGTHKLDILRQLRRSPEGRAFIPGVAGLDRAIKRHRRANLPLIGWIIRWLTGAEGNGATHRQLRIVLNEMGRVQSDQMMMARAIQQVAERTETLAERTERLAERMESAPPPSNEPPPPPPPPQVVIVEEQKPKMPRLDQGHMPETFDSTERRVLRHLRLFAAKHGAPA